MNMNIQQFFSRSFFLFSVFCVFPVIAAASPADWDEWHHGMDGYEAAMAAAEADRQPLIVYFHAEWCGWCRRLNEKYLTSEEVGEFLEPLERVEINPEKSEEGRQLFTEYGSTVFPGLYVLVPGSGQAPSRLSPFRGGEEIPIEDFIASIRREANTQYHHWAYGLNERRDFDTGLEVVAAAEAFDDSYDGMHGLHGRLLHQQAEERLDTDMLEQAREAYRQAIRTNPEDASSRHWLGVLGE